MISQSVSIYQVRWLVFCGHIILNRFPKWKKNWFGGGGFQPFAALIFEIPQQWVLKMFWDFIYCVHNILNSFPNGNWNLERRKGGGVYFTAKIFWTSFPIFIENWKGFKYLKQSVLNPLSNMKRNKENSIYSIFCGHYISKSVSNSRAQRCIASR